MKRSQVLLNEVHQEDIISTRPKGYKKLFKPDNSLSEKPSLLPSVDKQRSFVIFLYFCCYGVGLFAVDAFLYFLLLWCCSYCRCTRSFVLFVESMERVCLTSRKKSILTLALYLIALSQFQGSRETTGLVRMWNPFTGIFFF